MSGTYFVPRPHPTCGPINPSVRSSIRTSFHINSSLSHLPCLSVCHFPPQLLSHFLIPFPLSFFSHLPRVLVLVYLLQLMHLPPMIRIQLLRAPHRITRRLVHRLSSRSVHRSLLLPVSTHWRRNTRKALARQMMRVAHWRTTTTTTTYG